MNDLNVFKERKQIMVTKTAVAGRTVTRVRRSLRQRVEAILRQEITFIGNPRFARMKDVPFPEEPLHVAEEKSNLGGGARFASMFRTPILTHDAERQLFRRMNFLKFQASRLRERLDPARPVRSEIDRIESLLKDAQACRSLLVESNVRLVASIARRFRGGPLDFEELLSEGNSILLYAIDKFDVERGFRFSTYATYAIQRHFYRQVTRVQKRRQLETGTDASILVEIAGAGAPHSEPDDQAFPAISGEALDDLLRRLDERERVILQTRFGLGAEAGQTTLKAIASTVNLSKERVRQLQIQAIRRLREMVAAEPSWAAYL